MNNTSLTKQLFFASMISLLFLNCSPQLGFQFQGNYKAADETIEQEESFVQFVSPYKETMEEKMGTVIGVSEKALTKEGRENLLGNFVTDIQKEYVEKKFGLAVDISIINNGGMRNELPLGKITLGNIYELSPFDNYLVVLELQSNDVIKLAEFMTERKNMSVSGMRIYGEDNQLKEFSVNGKSVEQGKTYLLAINDYLANGGDNMDFLMGLHIKENSNILLRDMLIEMIQEKTSEGKNLNAEIEGRQIYR
ncbi:5'-nucleotidase C-terminal domain-containing protein [Belliella sp. DSM 107340]|uniref:5'-nucleotidase C-terminal domain-containing protein n=1 Tax=Belliella calami TaxID=2923436 RepID=A0ABS9USM3_9BACT|nr:5'-nucleotidase [Belliella calami]MCH7399618.1 5'-nucleotidase C-terminal domain-containing protein [Belliella calami]